MYKCLGDYLYDCLSCPTRCDGVSKGVYIFKNDTSFSEKSENAIIDKINKSDVLKATKCEIDGYPDIEIMDKKGGIVSYLEVKAQQRTFMSVSRILPESGLIPSETMALNLSDLLRYFDIQKKNTVDLYIIWVLINRLCIVKPGETKFFIQKIKTLEQIYNKVLDKRRFRRQSGIGDVVNGVHKGVVVNYHFSLRELIEIDINSKDFIEMISK